MLYFPGLCGQARDAEREAGSCGAFQMSLSMGTEGAGGRSFLQGLHCGIVIFSFVCVGFGEN